MPAAGVCRRKRPQSPGAANYSRPGLRDTGWKAAAALPPSPMGPTVASAGQPAAHDLPTTPRPMIPKRSLNMRAFKTKVVGSTSPRTWFDAGSIASTNGQLGSPIDWDDSKKGQLKFPVHQGWGGGNGDDSGSDGPPPVDRALVEQVYSMFAACIRGAADAEAKREMGLKDVNSFPPGTPTEEACAGLWKLVSGDDRPLKSHEVAAYMSNVINHAIGNPHFVAEFQKLEADTKSGMSARTSE